MARARTTEVECAACSKVFTKPLHAMRRRPDSKHYCSRPCANAGMKKPLARMCVACGQPFESIPSQVSRGLAKFCTRSCARTAENNPNWKGGITLTKNGYRGVWNGKSYDLEHRLVMEEILGRPLLDEEVVHHKDEDKLNNHPDNLEVMTRSEHTTHHMKGNSYARKG